jgi:coproporphyrinogen III oxidase-like Fe-S oxidoreductase
VSFDMIYARPNQTPEAWRAELSRALGEQQGHMSLYQLTIEPGTELQRYARLAGQALDPERLDRLVDGGFLVRSAGCHRIAATAAGRRVLNALIAELAAP